MTNTRAKFSCYSVTELKDGACQVELRPVTSGSDENREFYKYTPGGNIKLEVLNAETAGQFKPGHDYYVDFTEVEEPKND